MLIGDLVSPNDIVVLVTPIDESAPKGRLILPQQQMIRSILDAAAVNIVVGTRSLKLLAAIARKPKLVITDSQAFGKVSKIVPEDILLTSFSILFARYKGELESFTAGAAKLNMLADGDRVLISEGCTHHRQCNDIGTVKMPGWIKSMQKKELFFDFTSGGDFPSLDELRKYALVVHCGACMLNEREVHSRLEKAEKSRCQHYKLRHCDRSYARNSAAFTFAFSPIAAKTAGALISAQIELLLHQFAPI